jgi:hypothetical protein
MRRRRIGDDQDIRERLRRVIELAAIGEQQEAD